MTTGRRVQQLLACAVLCVAFAGTAHAAAACETVVGRLATLEGQVEVQRAAGGVWSPVQLDAELCQGDLVRAGRHSRATVVLVNQAVLRVDQNTAIRLDKISAQQEERSALSLLKGAFQSFSRKPRGFEVSTPYLNGSIEGTEFVFRVQDNAAELIVLEGIVVASNDQGRVSVSGGESATAGKGQAPQARTVVRPRDAVQWSLYYPPLLAAGGAGEIMSPGLKQAATALSVGRVDEALPMVEQAIARGIDAGLAHALRAVIHVVQNRPDQALADANQAVSLLPDSAAARIALSYAQQARFDIPGARDTMLQAVAKQPGEALAWARLAELHLMLGDKQQASAAANKAAALAPGLGRTQITLGFTALAEFRAADAQAAFERAIALDSADPLPHLGLGLARISQGNLEQGRADIELAVGLDSNDALLRAYLGKAYFEEKRAPLDSDQFAIAMQLDPNDPTAWLYSGIAKQTENRPVEAARDLERSIELNDNRAAYRGRLLLDKDRAARGTSLARAYKDMGLEQPAVNESTRSLTTDPSNASAHRFLSDTHRGVRRLEQSRTSELYQAQMLQDINVNPVQPSISSTNLNIVTLGGPTNPGFNEFTPLFLQNQTRFDASAVGGGNGTRGGEAVITTVHDRYSLSLGGFRYETDGYRENNNLEHRIYNVFGQADVSENLNVQFEFNRRETDNGDLAQNFDADDFNPQLDRHFETETYRLGARLKGGESSTALVSFIYNDRDEVVDQGLEVMGPLPCFLLDDDPLNPPPPPCDGLFTINEDRSDEADRETWQAEGLYIYQGSGFNVVSGVGFSSSDLMLTSNLTASLVDATTQLPIFPPQNISDVQDADIRNGRLYAYGNFETAYGVTWTAGLGYEDYEFESIDISQFNPKLGLQWDVNDVLGVRVAALRYVAPALANNRSLEPTQVAGFNQSFDDPIGTQSDLYGVALDWRPMQQVYAGIELSRRDLESPVFVGNPNSLSAAIFEDQDELHHRAYVNWTLHDRWVFGAEAVYDRFKTDGPSVDSAVPREVETISYPVSVSYFHPEGYFGYLGATYVEQEYTNQANTLSDDDSFTVTDLAVGYRLPKRRGIISLTVQNLFDKEFSYQDDSYRTFDDEPSVGPYVPDRLVMGRLTVNF